MLVAFLPRDNNYKWSLKPPISYGDPSGNDLQAQTKLWWRELLSESTHFTWSGGKSVLFGTQGLQFHLCYKHLFKVFSCFSISVFSSIKKAAAFLSSRLSPVLRCHLNSFLFPNTPLSRPQGLPDLLLDPVLPDLKRSFLWWSKGPATQVINWSQTTQKACPPLATAKGDKPCTCYHGQHSPTLTYTLLLNTLSICKHYSLYEQHQGSKHAFLASLPLRGERRNPLPSSRCTHSKNPFFPSILA